MSRKAGVDVCDPTCVEGRGSRCHVLKQSYFPILVFHIVSLEDNPVFPTSTRIALFVLVTFNDHKAEEIPKMYLFPSFLGLFCHSVPLGQSRPLPNLFEFKVLPFFPVSVHRRWMLLKLPTGNGTS